MKKFLDFKKKNSDYKPINLKDALQEVNQKLIDPSARNITSQVQWFNLKGLSKNNNEQYPIAIGGNGPPILCLHGFDSCFLEFRRLYPLLIKSHKLIIPDLYGFGFCPRPEGVNYDLDNLITHLKAVLNQACGNKAVGVIGASMGGAIAMEISRREPKRINKLLLLSPAGLVGKANKVPWPLNQLGASFLRQSFVRKELCKQAFANPETSVGPAEEQIASIHLNVPGWRNSLAAFAANGGVSNCGIPIPKQPLKILIGDKDRIIPKAEKKKVSTLLKKHLINIENCGHLPHLDQPELVAKYWSSY